MSRWMNLICTAGLMLAGWNRGLATEPALAKAAETRYLTFQVWPLMPGYPGIPPLPGRTTLSKEQMAEFVQGLVKAIGTTGDARHKLGFAIGPLCFDMPDDEIRRWIRDAFAVAREHDVAVALHIDDSMSWGRRKDLLSNPDNLETVDWKQTPNAARSLQWGPDPTRFPPQLCYNAPAVVAAAKARAALIGAEIKRELEVLKSQGKEHLFAAVIAGWETQIGQEFGTNRHLGFRALAHRGFSQANPPKDLDAERVGVVKEWIELWCNALHAAGTPREKVFCHIAFTDQGLRKADARESYVQKVAFAPPEVAFSPAFRPGFSTYPEGKTFQEVYDVLARHGSPGWISAEGTNVSPTSMPGEPTMETYLGRVFNHGGVLVNIFSWGIGGEAQRNNFFRRSTENPEALAAYAKFLRGEKLVESATGFSAARLQAKMHRIQAELPGWVQKTGQHARVMPLIQRLQSHMKERKWQELDKVADELLALMKASPVKTPPATPIPTEPPPTEPRKTGKQLPASPSLATSNEPKYLIFWTDAEKAGELAERVGMKGDGKTRLLGFGLPNPTFEIENQLPGRIRSAFAAARAHNMAVMLHFDFHLAWKKRPDLWNWFDPTKPGYNPDNKNNVEWHGWDGPPNKVRYLNHGVLERLPPHMSLTSKAVRSEIRRIVSKVIAPVLREEIARLKAEGKQDLFAGVLVGLEPSIDDYSKPEPECAKMMKQDGVSAGPLGYRALLDRGFSAKRPPEDLHMALAKIIQETVDFWCEQFVDAGIPAARLYPHVAAPAPIEMMNAPIWTAFNKHSRPGWTTYAVEVLGDGFQPIYDELAKRGNPAWAGVEANAGMPGSVVDWETYLAWHYNHGCVLVGVNMGATGEELPKRLWDSAFGNEALAAYHKFLSGQPLVEKPVAKERPQIRIQKKIRRVRDGIERWHKSGKDPSAVGKLMQAAQPLANAGKLDELEKLVDKALQMLGESEQTPPVYRPQ